MHNIVTEKRVWGTLHPFIEYGDIMGRSSANAAFLKALLLQNPYEAYHFFLQEDAHCEQLRHWIAEIAPDLESSGAVYIATRTDLPRALANQAYHCFHLSDCMLDTARLARVRNAYACNIFPITGPTHSLSYAWYPSAFLSHLWQGTCGRDAVIATSRAAKVVLQNMYATLHDAYGLDADIFRTPRIAKIPLAIAAEQVVTDVAVRHATRKELNITDTQCMVLILGRISHYSKMDITPVLRAFQRLLLGGLDVSTVVLVIAGWTEEHDTTVQTLQKLAHGMGLPLQIVGRPSDSFRNALYQAADIFLSPSDNVQETFGLTILEAAGAGLPVVASDWSGYRDLIEHEVTGLLVPTLGTPDASESETFAGVLYDNHYHMLLAQQTAVDVPRLADALKYLLENPVAAREMGKKAQQRVWQDLTWDTVLQRHVLLWDELSAIPVDNAALRGAVHPQQLRYSRIFTPYPSALPDDQTFLQWSRVGQAVYRGVEYPIIYGGITERITEGTLRCLLFCARKPVAAPRLVDKLAQEGLYGERAWFLVLWALKQDLLEVCR